MSARTLLCRGTGFLAAGLVIASCAGAPAATKAPTPVVVTASPTLAPTSSPLPSASASPATIETAGPSPTGAPSGFPAMPALPDGWTWRNDPAKTYRIGLPPFLAFVYPKDSGIDPTFAAEWGIKGSYWDTRHLTDKYMTQMTIEDLPYAKAVTIHSSSELLAWAEKDIAANGAPGGIIESTTTANVHQGYAVSITTTAPASTQTNGLVEHVFDIYYASPTGIWDVNVVASGDAAWSDLSPTLPLLPPYFEAPLEP